ncbi:MAG: citrate/2-methylcitrate synthase, partial [Janthinobacterium lividum]
MTDVSTTDAALDLTPQQPAPAETSAEAPAAGGGGGGGGRDSLTVTDNRTGQTYELAITDGTIRAADLKQINADGQGLATYDPGFVNTASCRSAVTYIDGDAGILEYRGYPIEQLAEHSTFLEVAYLLLNGELPNSEELEQWVHDITIHTFLHENVKQLMQGYR